MSENGAEADEVLQNHAGEIGKLREMGITDFAILTYLKRIREGKNQEESLRGLLRGRSLTSDQVRLIRQVLGRLSNRAKPSSEAGFLRIEPALVSAADRLCRRDTLFFSGLLLMVSPILTWGFLQTPAILGLLLAGLVCSAGALTIPQLTNPL